MQPYSTFVDYDSSRDGQVAVGTVTMVDSAGNTWFDATGISHIVIRAAVAGGTTTFTVEQSREAGASALATDSGITSASAAAVGGATVAISYKFVRIKIVQTVATSTNMQVAVKGLAS